MSRCHLALTSVAAMRSSPVFRQPLRLDPPQKANPLHARSYLRDCGSLHPLSGVQRSTIIRYAGQKLNWLMLSEVKTNGGPSRTVLSAPTVNEPSLPAVNFWPCEPLSLPDATCTAA